MTTNLTSEMRKNVVAAVSSRVLRVRYEVPRDHIDLNAIYSRLLPRPVWDAIDLLESASIPVPMTKAHAVYLKREGIAVRLWYDEPRRISRAWSSYSNAKFTNDMLGDQVEAFDRLINTMWNLDKYLMDCFQGFASAMEEIKSCPQILKVFPDVEPFLEPEVLARADRAKTSRLPLWFRVNANQETITKAHKAVALAVRGSVWDVPWNSNTFWIH